MTARKTPAAKKAAPKAAPKVEPKAPEPEVVHLADGRGCTCGWLPNFYHVIGVQQQQERHLAKNPPQEN